MPEIPLVPARWRFPAHPASVPRARHAAAASLPDVLRSHLGDGLGLLTSELVPNAIRHGACGEDGDLVELVLWPADGHYWLAVSDPGTGKPVLAHPDSDSESGRGLFLDETEVLLVVDGGGADLRVRPGCARRSSGCAGD
ncbi:ATP-binding protein [Streptomyces sp. NPDC088124]|uniref:ATP-binding protein n=1 Tax=Streptomyces sp. NPDC088124 TaxID=3154654 RepID=UPI003444F803